VRVEAICPHFFESDFCGSHSRDNHSRGNRWHGHGRIGAIRESTISAGISAVSEPVGPAVINYRNIARASD